jgi:hypothetical protein
MVFTRGKEIKILIVVDVNDFQSLRGGTLVKIADRLV